MKKAERRACAPAGSLRAALESLPDVRRGQGKVHPLDGMLALAVCAQVCGCRSLYSISQWGRECEAEIRVALGLRAERGPSVATLHRAFRRLDHGAFERVLGQWFAAQGLEPDEALAVDGKTLVPAGSCTLAPSERSLSRAGAAFDDALQPVRLTDPDTRSALHELLDAFAEWVRVIRTGEGECYAALHAQLSSDEERMPRAS